MSGAPKTAPTAAGLSAQEKTDLLHRLALGRKQAPPPRPAAIEAKSIVPKSIVDELSGLESYEQLRTIRSAAEILGIADPFFRAHDGIAGAETEIGGRRFINFSSYNYLGLNGHPEVAEAAKAAIDRYGTSVSASRVVSGERPIHRELELRLARLHGAEDCIVMVSGHATNVSVIGHLLSKGDLILHDALIHNSAVQGAQLSGARRLSFPHNDAAALGRLLEEQAGRYRHALIVIEGHYSMDGDLADLPEFSALARAHNAWLLVDEAHSLGVVGARGHGVAEHFGLGTNAADLWMGTLSKTLAGCGGYIAGRRELIDYLKLSTPGFVYSVGLSPPVAAAAVAALDIMEREPERVSKLQTAARRFLDGARRAGLDAGQSVGLGIVPIITGGSILAARLSDALFTRGINVQPILYPAVPEQSARLRFFLSSDHTAAHIDTAIAALAEETARLAAQTTDLAALALAMRQRHS
jgi:8-amino-7-oxononanoate synthase